MKICPMCGAAHHRDRNFLTNRKNLTCSETCRQRQRLFRQAIRRHERRYQEYRLWHLSKNKVPKSLATWEILNTRPKITDY